MPQHLNRYLTQLGWLDDLDSGDITSIEPLSQGLSNRHYRVRTQHSNGTSGDYHLRKLNHHTPWVNRAQEMAIWRAAHNAGIAPELVKVNDDYYLSRWQSHVKVSAAECLTRFYQLLPRWCALETELAGQIERFSMEGRLRLYHGLLAERADKQVMDEAEVTRQAALKAIDSLEASPLTWGLCHLDLHSGNLLCDEQTYLIDFEYACIAPIILDIASLIENQMLPLGVSSSNEVQQAIVAYQAEYPQLQVSDEQLNNARTLMRAYAWYWYALMD
ncbi:phosphotransferase [Paraferrimonas haliotis]|uniref:phosphotransferase n=1 Tax=Paraferrimonas haliotis TaxID=2013866 RepID=UPI000BA9CBC5|nr:phosphotransferase [Paraferrimonas haliotis]